MFSDKLKPAYTNPPDFGVMGPEASQLPSRYNRDVWITFFDILGVYRQSIHDLQTQFINARRQHVAYSHQQTSVMSQALHFLNNNTIQLLEVEALYNGIQCLMSGSISHYLLPHDHLARALLAVDGHLRERQPHMVLTRMDSAYYYNDAAFRTFRHLNTLFIALDAPVTTINVRPRFQIDDLVPIPLHAPHRADYYSVLATDVQTIGFARDADHIIQLTGKTGLPEGDVWFASDPSIVLLDRNKPTCARALITSNLVEIKSMCRYTIHRYPYPRLVRGHSIITSRLGEGGRGSSKRDTL